ncbi:MAG: YggU family protein, partial [Gammaproteobacteria bacterium]|nr:YggU family protein [Gammaproteobacteria bacterium]MCP4702943.1 YggU family protein [Gammaproteobacteria bacterium]
MEFYHWEGKNLYLSVRVVPHAKKDSIVGVHGDRLKIRVIAP